MALLDALPFAPSWPAEAMVSAAPAIEVKPKRPAIRATTRKTRAQLSMTFSEGAPAQGQGRK